MENSAKEIQEKAQRLILKYDGYRQSENEANKVAEINIDVITHTGTIRKQYNFKNTAFFWANLNVNGT